ncbi:uncharacterized protein [Primulina eburnea]|uniref:uncharacterized protein n=1 Tax=Primulina eburnea TaxID=1245227 RepID=UPI003C6CA013
MGTPSWVGKFPLARLRNLSAPVSDHSPILLETEVKEKVFQKHQFRFENRWLREPELQPIVEECWTRNRESDVLRRLTLCSKVLDPWGKTVDGNFRTKIRKCKEKLESLRDKYDEESTTKFKETNAQLASLLVEEEDY